MSRRLRIAAFLSLSALFLIAVIGIAVYEMHAPSTFGKGDASASTSALHINLNTATKEDLCLLSGVGPSTAKAILAYRDTVGCFRSVEDLLEVSGISETLLDSWRPYLSV